MGSWSDRTVESLEVLGREAGAGAQRLVGGALPSEPCALGVDEAGRGPVLGPMVYGIAFCALADADLLKRLGCADSKSLTEEKRERIFETMLEDEHVKSRLGWAVDVISPNYISNCMLRRVKHSLNEVSMDSAINLIKEAAAAGVNIAEVYVDTVGPPEKYQAKLAQIFPSYKITVAKKADSTYPIVSAASIAAKVTRDRALKSWKFIENLDVTQKDFGSGYPGDPVTKKFIQERLDPVFGYPRLVRFSWSTAESVIEENGYNFTWDEDEETQKKHKKSPAVGTKRISSFFATKNEERIIEKKKRHIFFRDRFLSLTQNF